MNIHLVFPQEYIDTLENAFDENGIQVVEKDTTIDTFAQWATSSNECNSDLAFVYGSGDISTSQSSFSQKQAIYERLKEVRLARESLKIIVIFPKIVEQDKVFISKLVQLGIVDLYFSDEMTVEDILSWFHQPKTLADVQELIGEYKDERESRIEDIQIKEEFEKSKPNQELEEVKEPKEKRFNFKMPSFSMPSIPKPKASKEKIEDEELSRVTKKKKIFIDLKVPSFSFPQKQTKMLQPKTIAVGSLHGGAGSTFLIHNFTCFLSDLNLISGVLETSIKSAIWYEMSRREGVQLQNFDSWCSQIMRSGSINQSAKIQIDNTYIIPFHPKDKIEDLTTDNIQGMIHAAKQVPYLFVDLSSNWDNPLAEEVIKHCDEFWVVTRPDPNHLFSQQTQKRTFLNKAIQYIGEENCIFIGNGWEKGIDAEDFPIQTFINIPYFSENVQAVLQGLPLYGIKARLFDKSFEKLKSRIVHAVGKVSLFQ